MSSFFNDFTTPTDDPQFYQRVFTAIAKTLKTESDPIKKIIQEEYDGLSLRLDRSLFQESCSTRVLLRSRHLASLLITDEGELKESLVQQAIDCLTQHLYSLGPARQYDTPRQKHLLKALKTLAFDKNVQRELKLVTRPYSHKVADQILRDTLRISPNQTLTDADARRAVLSAWFCYLRQNVGSCFATAPAIIVQNEQPEAFFKDIKELLDTGRIKRIFGGNEYTVPLSSSSGAGEFKKHILVESLDDLSFSPGLIHALESVNLIDPGLALKQKIVLTRKLVGEVVKYPILSAEELMQKILMHAHEITEKDLKDYANRPREMMQTSLLMNVPGKAKGKMEASRVFFEQMELAKEAFNSLTENALLKMWEFSLASFAETKPGFTRWNMYASLGFNTDQPGGIADCLYRDIKERLDRANAKVKEYQEEYEVIYTQLKFIEGRLRSVSTEKEAQWGKIDYESKRGEFRAIEELRDKEHFKAERFAYLITDLLDKYDALFPRYFQEVYDADMHEVTSSQYDDSPAGFRLLFKHGRENTSQWTLIYSPQEFIENLSSFFVMTEPEIINDPDFAGLHDDLSQVITSLVSHLKTEEFLISAFHRMAKAHNAPIIKNPLEHLDKIDKKPWAYTSGGTMNNLISCYFKLDGKPTVVERWVENPLELLVFFIDTIKQIPYTISEKYLASPDLALLIHSPTHAFTFRPGLPALKKAVESEGFTYTWTRDNLVRPGEAFIDFMFLDQEMMQFLLQKFGAMIQEESKARFESVTSDCYGRKTPPEFREFILDALDKDPILNLEGRTHLSPDQIDSSLFQWLPLTSRYEMKNRAEIIFDQLPGLTQEIKSELSEVLEEMLSRFEKNPYLTASDLQNLCKAALCIVLKQTSTGVNYPYLIHQACQKLGYALPEPVIFADTNWVKEWFAFAVNPGTGKLDLFRVDPIGQIGTPMSQWRHWLNGTDRSNTWGLFVKPQEYRN